MLSIVVIADLCGQFKVEDQLRFQLVDSPKLVYADRPRKMLAGKYETSTSLDGTFLGATMNVPIPFVIIHAEPFALTRHSRNETALIGS